MRVSMKWVDSSNGQNGRQWVVGRLWVDSSYEQLVDYGQIVPMSSWLGFGLIDMNSGYEYLTSWLSSTSVLGMSILGESIYEMGRWFEWGWQIMGSWFQWVEWQTMGSWFQWVEWQTMGSWQTMGRQFL